MQTSRLFRFPSFQGGCRMTDFRLIVSVYIRTPNKDTPKAKLTEDMFQAVKAGDYVRDAIYDVIGDIPILVE